MVIDQKNGKLHRLDQMLDLMFKKRLEKVKNDEEKKAIEAVLHKIPDMDLPDFKQVMSDFKIVSPDGNPLSEPAPFNLMFTTSIGPGAKAISGHLRPETAQGIFVNFPRLYEFNRKVLPFATAQVGVSYRNEIAPRNELVRCREFQMAEIEHFADPTKLNDFPKFEIIASLKASLFSIENQLSGGSPAELDFKTAVEQNIIAHKTLAYFMGRTYLFLVEIGIDKTKIRFRQHLPRERAHYAKDCWDAELFVGGGWLECVGLADRQSFDLTQHSLATAKSGEKYNTQLQASEPLPEPIVKEVVQIQPVMSEIAKAYKSNRPLIPVIQKQLQEIPDDQGQNIFQRYEEAEKILGGKPAKGAFQKTFNNLAEDQKQKFLELTKIAVDGNEVTYEMVNIAKVTEVQRDRQFHPCVIEPSFGIGRIMTALLEHNFYVRENDIRRVLRFKPLIAPYKCSVFPVGSKIISPEKIQNIRNLLRKANVYHQVDASGASIGKRYSRSDEIGTPFGITLDDKTNEDGSVTLRERDSMLQVRCSVEQAVQSIVLLSTGLSTWEDIAKIYPAFSTSSSE